ncbi:MAG: hypothetical protein JSV24_02270 [Bacteroidales bacterium]|nr:MAG: hypothetical protein JSV24_02270 [Bacteroidales bacterium]
MKSNFIFYIRKFVISWRSKTHYKVEKTEAKENPVYIYGRNIEINE